MSILEKEVLVRISNRNYKYYSDLGYEIPMQKNELGKLVCVKNVAITVGIEHLSKSSSALVTKICDLCHIEIGKQTYDRVIRNRNKNKTGLDYCLKCGRLSIPLNRINNIPYEKSIAKIAPHLVNEWDNNKNNKSPEKVSAKSNFKYWWICPNCKSSYDATPSNRVAKGVETKCPYCARKKANHTNCLALTHPDIAKDWHPTMNGELTPYNTLSGTHKRVWWLCKKCDDPYKARVLNRTSSDTGCPSCTKSKGENYIEGYLKKNNVRFIPQFRSDECKYKNPLPFDFAIFDIKGNLCFLIEYDGEQHFEPVKKFGGEKAFRKTQKKDNIKNDYCVKNNIKLLRIPYWEFDNIESILHNELEKYNIKK